MVKLIIAAVCVCGCLWLLHRFSFLTDPAFHVAGMGVPWGFLVFGGVMGLVMRLKTK